MSEASGITHVEDPRFTLLGSVGPGVPGVKCRIDDPDENGIGEVYARGF